MLFSVSYCGLRTFDLPLSITEPLVSGFLLAYKTSWQTKSFWENVVYSCKNLLFPFVGFAVIFIIFSYIRHLILGTSFSLYAILKSCYLLELGPCWFLPALFKGQVLFYALKKIKISSSIIIIIAACIVILSAHFLHELKPYKYEYRILLFISRGFMALFWLSLGYFIFNLMSLFQYLVDNRYSYNNYIKFVIIILITIYATRYNTFVDIHFTKIGNPLLYFPISIAGSISIVLIIKNIKFKNFLSYLGRNSLIIMGTHISILCIVPLSSLIAMDIYIFKSKTLQSLWVCIICITIELFIIKIINSNFKFFINYNDFYNKIFSLIHK